MSTDAVNAPNMRVPNRMVLQIGRAVGVVVLIISIGLWSYQLLFGHPFTAACLPSGNDALSSALCGGLRWEYYLTVGVVGLLSAIIAHSKYNYYYVAIREGVMIGKVEFEYLRYPFQVHIEGFTRAGEKQTTWHAVSYDDWHMFNVGETVCLGK